MYQEMMEADDLKQRQMIVNDILGTYEYIIVPKY